MRRVAKVVIAVVCGAEVGLLLLLNVYAFIISKSNHTGVPLPWLMVMGGITTVAGALLLVERRLVPRAWSLCLTIVSLLLIANVVALERANILMEYETWARKGMPGG